MARISDDDRVPTLNDLARRHTALTSADIDWLHALVSDWQLLADLSGFVSALDSTFGGFRTRAEGTYRVLQAPETAFLVVAVPEPETYALMLAGIAAVGFMTRRRA